MSCCHHCTHVILVSRFLGQRVWCHKEWKWDTETWVRAPGLMTSMKSSENLVSFCVTKIDLQLLKGISSKFQKRDIYQAYLIIDDTIHRLENIRRKMDQEFADWFREATALAAPIEEDIKMSRLTGRQTHRKNPAFNKPEDYFRRAVAI